MLVAKRGSFFVSSRQMRKESKNQTRSALIIKPETPICTPQPKDQKSLNILKMTRDQRDPGRKPR